MDIALKIPQHEYAQARIIATVNDDNIEKISLLSYSTVVIVVDLTDDSSTIKLTAYGRFSATTAKHIGWFTDWLYGENLYHHCKLGSYQDPMVLWLSGEYCKKAIDWAYSQI